MVHGSDVDVDRLHQAEVPLDSREVLVGRDDSGRVELAVLDRRAQHVDAVERGLLGDRRLVAREAEGVLFDCDGEVLGHLVAVEHLAEAQGDRVLAPQRSARALACADEVFEVGLGRGEQRLALSGPLFGQERVLRTDESLTGIVGMGDLAEVHLVEQAHLQRT